MMYELGSDSSLTWHSHAIVQSDGSTGCSWEHPFDVRQPEALTDHGQVLPAVTCTLFLGCNSSRRL